LLACSSTFIDDVFSIEFRNHFKAFFKLVKFPLYLDPEFVTQAVYLSYYPESYPYDDSVTQDAMDQAENAAKDFTSQLVLLVDATGIRLSNIASPYYKQLQQSLIEKLGVFEAAWLEINPEDNEGGGRYSSQAQQRAQEAQNPRAGAQGT